MFGLGIDVSQGVDTLNPHGNEEEDEDDDEDDVEEEEEENDNTHREFGNWNANTST